MNKLIKRIFQRNKSVIPTYEIISDKDVLIDCDANVHAINAFFTCFVDYEHSSFFNLSNVNSDHEVAAIYFGSSEEGRVTFSGVQTKNLYKLVEFITVNELWPVTGAEPEHELNLEELDGYEIDTSGSTFKKVIEALDAAESKHEDIGKAFRTYKLIFFYIAYSEVRKIGIENLTGKHPMITGRMAMNSIHKITMKKPRRWFSFKRIFGLSMILIIFYVVLYFLNQMSNFSI